MSVSRSNELGALAGVAGGFAPLGSDLHVPASYLKHAVVLLAAQTASSSATLDFTSVITSNFDEYMVDFTSIRPATAGANFLARVSKDNGANWESGASAYVGMTMQNATVTNFTANALSIATNVAATGTGPFGVYGHLWAYAAAYRPWFVGQVGYLTNVPTRVVGAVSGDFEPDGNNSAFNAIRFLFSSGNIADGSIRIYGVAKS